jgi:hypothetical protein
MANRTKVTNKDENGNNTFLEQKKKIVPMSWQNALIILAFIIGLFALLLALIIPPVNFGAKCDVKGIQYKNVCPLDCWNADINCKFCPLPSDLSCDLNAKAPVLKLIEMFR